MGYCENIVKKIKKENPHFEEESNLLRKDIEKQAKIISNLDDKTKLKAASFYGSKNKKKVDLIIKNRFIDPSLKLSKYRIGLTFVTIITGFSLAYVFSEPGSKQIWGIFPFFISAFMYLMATYYMTDKKIIVALKHESIADFLLLIGTFGVLVDLIILNISKITIILILISIGFYLLVWGIDVLRNRKLFW